MSKTTSPGPQTPLWQGMAVRGLKVWIARLVFAMLGVFLVLGMMEVCLRVLGLGSDQFFQPDPLLGVRHFPSKHGIMQGSCFRANVTTNSYGWRNRETSWEKPNGVFRIIVLGDSFMDALQVNDDQTFASVLEQILNQVQSHTRIEVINLGCASYGTDQEYLALKHYGLRYQPDLVLLAFFSQNDVQNNLPEMEREGSTYPKPFFRLRQGRLEQIPYRDPTPAHIALARKALAPFRVYSWVKEKALSIPPLHRLLFRMGVVGVVPQEADEGVYPRRWRHQLGVYGREYSEQWERAWALTESLLQKTRSQVNEAGADFLLVGVADPVSVLPSPLFFQDFPGLDRDVLDFDKPVRWLDRFSRKERIDFLSLTSTFRARIGERAEAFDELYYSCDGHWTPAGHRLAAETVADYIRARVSQPKTGIPIAK